MNEGLERDGKVVRAIHVVQKPSARLGRLVLVWRALSLRLRAHRTSGHRKKCREGDILARDGVKCGWSEERREGGEGMRRMNDAARLDEEADGESAH